MRSLQLFLLLILGGCATRYLVPANRFITPETQGGVLHGQFELQYTKAHELNYYGVDDSLDEGVTYTRIPRSGYMLSTSLFDALDFVWTHTASANSLVGGKVQFLGASRTGKSAGHKLALAALVGGNEHATVNKSVVFRLDGQEILLIYGYRISDVVMPYLSLGSSTYTFVAELTSPYPLNGTEPDNTTEVTSVNGGVDFSVESFFGKAEVSYQKIKTTETADTSAVTLGISAGVNW